MGITGFRPAALAATLAGFAALAAPALADLKPGAYLAGRQAVLDNDFDQAARYYSRALQGDPQNGRLMEGVAGSQLSLGRLDAALPPARAIEELGLRSQIAHMIVALDLMVREDYEALLERDPEQVGIGQLADGLIAAWAHMGAGSVARGLEQFDAVAGQPGLRGFARYHKAMALAMVGDFEGAEAIFADLAEGAVMRARRGVLAHAEVLSQLGRNEDALRMLVETFGAGFDPGLTDVVDRLAAGETLPFSHVRSVQDGLAEVFFTIASVLNGEAADDYALFYARAASILRPDHVDAILLSARLLDSLGQFDLAVKTYKQVPADSADAHAAELGRAEALRNAGKPDAAIEVLEQLAQDQPTLPMVHTALGDLLRQQEDYAEAVSAYDRALEYSEEDVASRWFLLYARGISHERQDNWPQAEADFRAALELRPDQPQVLNYLGYSLVEKQIKLDEALEMIERAVAARPDSGYIVDSLGWVLYRLGRYDEAVGHMEKAVELMPVDPVVNDHLGDVYWAVGRIREAEFQWKRALSFIEPGDSDNEADPDRIRRKLEVGLDAVLAEEGAPPLKVANGH